MPTQIYNRLIQTPTKKPHILFNGAKIPLGSLDISQVVKKSGKPYSVYFRHKIIKGVRRE